MTEIVFNTKALTITAQGHAGTAPKGSDLACCGASVLLYGLTAALNEFEVPFDCEEDDGYFHIALQPHTGDSAAYTVFYAFIAALLELGKQYDAVSVRKERI